jgi:hypothetical protein
LTKLPRNLTSGEYYKIWVVIDNRKKAGRPNKLAQNCANSKPIETIEDQSSIEVMKARRVLDRLNPVGGDRKSVEAKSKPCDQGIDQQPEIIEESDKRVEGESAIETGEPSLSKS